MLTVASVAVKPLPEPDKRISHIRLLLESSERLKFTTRVEVLTDCDLGKAQASERVLVSGPRVRFPLALSIEPFVQNALGVEHVFVATRQTVRDGVVVLPSIQVPCCR